MITPTALTAYRPSQEALQALAWRALKLFVRSRSLRAPGLARLGEKCSTVTLDMRGKKLDQLTVKQCMQSLARGVPRGAVVSVAEFTKPPPEAVPRGEALPELAAIATDQRASLQVLYGQSFLRFAVTWDPRRRRLH